MTVKEQVQELALKLPEDADWDQVMYQLYVREKIARGLKDAKAGRVVSHEEIKRRFLGQ
jgi:predicted transcriptional regulator